MVVRREYDAYGNMVAVNADSATGATVHRYYVAAGSATVVLTRQAGGKNGVAYLHADALGSTDVVTDGAGKVAGAAGERRSYDAFGARQHPTWGQPPPASGFTSKASPMGFTGDDELGLINMRGRLYDPKLGRFLSTQIGPFASLRPPCVLAFFCRRGRLTGVVCSRITLGDWDGTGRGRGRSRLSGRGSSRSRRGSSTPPSWPAEAPATR